MSKIELPSFKPELELKFSQVVEELKYCRRVSPEEIPLYKLSKVLYAIQGVTRGVFGTKVRTIPSAGATYPLVVYVEPYSREVKGGFYRYSSTREYLGELHLQEERETSISKIYIHAVFARTTRYYGLRGENYVLMEVGHALQNALLESTSLGLGLSYSLNVEEMSRSVKEGEEPIATLELGSCTEKPKLSYDVSIFKAKAVSLKIPELPEIALEEAIVRRRSIRRYSSPTISLNELAYVLYNSCGRVWGGDRPYAPPGGVYCLNVFLVIGNVKGLNPGIYFYNDRENSLVLIREGDLRREICRAALSQEWVLEAPASIVLASKANVKKQFLYVETGMVGQNVYLAATSVGLGTVAIGAFYDEEVAEVLKTGELPLYIMPLGRL